MIDWYWTVLNTPHCEVTPLMTASVVIPIATVVMVIFYWTMRR